MKIFIRFILILFLSILSVNVSIAKEYAGGTFSTINISKPFYNEDIDAILLNENKLLLLYIRETKDKPFYRIVDLTKKEIIKEGKLSLNHYYPYDGYMYNVLKLNENEVFILTPVNEKGKKTDFNRVNVSILNTNDFTVSDKGIFDLKKEDRLRCANTQDNEIVCFSGDLQAYIYKDNKFAEMPFSHRKNYEMEIFPYNEDKLFITSVIDKVKEENLDYKILVLEVLDKKTKQITDKLFIKKLNHSTFVEDIYVLNDFLVLKLWDWNTITEEKDKLIVIDSKSLKEKREINLFNLTKKTFLPVILQLDGENLLIFGGFKYLYFHSYKNNMFNDYMGIGSYDFKKAYLYNVKTDKIIPLKNKLKQGVIDCNHRQDIKLNDGKIIFTNVHSNKFFSMYSAVEIYEP